MKKPILLFSALVSLMSANAQITITSADVATVGKVIYQATDTMPTGISAGSAGASQTWNMTALSQDYVDTLSFISYGWAPNPEFSPSNLVIKQGTEDVYSYAVNNSTSLVALGVAGTVDFGGGPENFMQKNTPPEILANFPANYNGSFTNNYRTVTYPIYAGAAPVDSFRSTSSVQKNVLIDAWGSLTTPLGTYNVLRMKETKVTRDTADAYLFGAWMNAIQVTADSSTQYTWWANGVGFPLVTVQKDSSGAVYEATWLMALPATGINEQTAVEEAIVYPNPAQNQVSFVIKSKADAVIYIYDITGKLVTIADASGDLTTINTTAFQNGTYSYSVLSKNNELLNRGKFSIAK